MPGGYGIHEYFQNIHVWYNNAWRQPTSWTVDNTFSNYFANWSMVGAMDIWDWSCYD